MIRSRTPRPLATWKVAALSVLLGLSAAALSADSPHTESPGACVEDGCGNWCQERLAETRLATAKYLNEERALKDGYVPTPVCAAIPGVGAMGIHYPDHDRILDPAIDPRYPEVLLYEPRPNGKRRLVGVEWVVPVFSNGAPWFGGADEPPPMVDNPAPVLFGQTFQGPMPGHAPGEAWHYDLHVWIWRHNPSGTFAQWNPKVTCP